MCVIICNTTFILPPISYNRHCTGVYLKNQLVILYFMNSFENTCISSKIVVQNPKRIPQKCWLCLDFIVNKFDMLIK